MHPRRRALLGAVVVVLALLSPTATHHPGTAGARVLAAVPDALPVARLASADHHESAPVLDGASVVTGGVDPLAAALPDQAPATLAPTSAPGAHRSRGPPQV